MYDVAKVGSTYYAAESGRHDIYQSGWATDGGDGNIFSSTDQAKSWHLLHAFNHPVVDVEADPTDSNTLYASVVDSTDGGIYVTHNLGAGTVATWSKLPAPPRTQGHPYKINVLSDGALVVSYSANETTGALTPSSGVFYLPKNGTWQDRTLIGSNPNPDMRYWTTDVVVDPANPAIWYAGVRNGHGGNGNDAGGLYRTIDSGVHWQRVFVSPAVESVAIGAAGDIYVTTETDGLFYSPTTTNLAATLSRVSSFPFQHPLRVFFDPYHSQRVFVATFGAGVIAANVGDFTPPTITGANFSQDADGEVLSVNFSEAVPANLVPAGAFIKNLTTGQVIPGSAFTVTFDAATNQAKLTAKSPLPNGNYRLTFPAESVSDSSGNALADDYTLNFSVPSVNAPPNLLSTTFGDGTAQRSIVRSVSLTFDHSVTLGTGAVRLNLLNTSGSGQNNGSAATDASAALGTPTTNDGGLTWTIPIKTNSAFSDATGSLNDGIYTVTVHAAKVTDASNNTLAGGDKSITFHRLFGDIDGSKTVNNSDFGSFRNTFNLSSANAGYVKAFDFNNDGVINNADFGAFRNRFNRTFVY